MSKAIPSAIQERRQALQELHDRLLTMPSKVSYEQMVPLSKVAFCPGKLIHTNEFKIGDEHDPNPNLDKIDLVSYIDAAEILKQRILALDLQSESLSNNQNQSKFVESSLKSNIAASETLSPANNKSPTTKAPEPISKEPSSSATLADASTKPRVFEIREYFDEGSETAGTDVNFQIPSKHEVQDITEQIEKMERFTSKPEGNIPHSSYLNVRNLQVRLYFDLCS